MAYRLEEGELDGSYAEGAIILCSAISAMSSLMWNFSKGGDKRRFVEALVQTRSNDFDPSLISIPLLSREIPGVFTSLPSDPCVYITGSVDKSEQDVLQLCNSRDVILDHKKIREYSYANLLYTQVRCGFIHQYEAGENAAEAYSWERPSLVNNRGLFYVNRIKRDGDAMIYNRLIHFSLEWISGVAGNIAAVLDKEYEKRGGSAYRSLEWSPPLQWWIDGQSR